MWGDLVNRIFATWLIAYGTAFLVSQAPKNQKIYKTLYVVSIGALVYQLQKLPALGDSGFYLGQAKDVLKMGSPTFPLANLRSAAIAGLIMNMVITFAPLLRNFYSTLFVLPTFIFAGGGGANGTILLLSTSSVYFLKPNYMDFYPAAVAVGVLAVWSHLRTFSDTNNRKIFFAAVTAGLAVATHLLLSMVVVAYVVHILLTKNKLQEKLKLITLYVAITVITFKISLWFFKFMTWPLIDGNSTGGIDGKFLAPHLLSHEQIFHTVQQVIISLAAPLILLRLSIGRQTSKKYVPFIASLCLMYTIFLAIYGFDLGLVPDLDLQMLPSALIVGTICMVFAIEKITIRLKHAIYVTPLVMYTAYIISNLPR